ncbi:hypothetical protein IWQ60_002605 [Tieghemiomyces parasiticus]|uniref:ATP-dependent RNA helicase n=1 Tax=Tieghemiomyces parasiticus TaxID=78921 RepID=A0A9W8AB16_9FUNG|nr:hypothetical protein IWQ60_002605 [Tieghemiomyces parasiticus]
MYALRRVARPAARLARRDYGTHFNKDSEAEAVENLFRATSERTFDEFDTQPWTQLGLPEPLAQAMLKVSQGGPLSLQRQLIPDILAGRRPLAVTAEEGSGKTLTYALPLLARFLQATASSTPPPGGQAYALILAPTPGLVQQIALTFRELVRLADLHLGVRNGVTGRVLTEKIVPAQSNPPYFLVATASSLLQRNPVSLRHLEERLAAVRTVVVDELQTCLSTVDQPTVYRLLRMLTTGKDTDAVRREMKPVSEFAVPGHCDPQHYAAEPFTYFRLSPPGLAFSQIPKKFVFLNSTPFDSAQTERAVLEDMLGLREVKYVRVPPKGYYRPDVAEIMVNTPTPATPEDHVTMVMETLDVALARIRQLSRPNLHRLVLVVADSFTQAKLLHTQFAARTKAYQAAFAQFRRFLKPTSEDGDPEASAQLRQTQLFNVEPHLLGAEWARHEVQAVMNQLREPCPEGRLDYYPPGIPTGAGRLSVVFLGGDRYANFLFPNVANVIVTDFGRDIYEYLYWAGKAGLSKPEGEIISLVQPIDRIFSRIVERCNHPLVVDAPATLTKYPRGKIPHHEKKLPPFDDTNYTGIRKAGELLANVAGLSGGTSLPDELEAGSGPVAANRADQMDDDLFFTNPSTGKRI